ncbi:hypothetical protein [Camel associated porprismacovirus 1]|uniref:Capsid protein n=1 Tax=Camel associated porprismacovirus 1 TaxID=2170105 RepID=A0A0A1ENV3_9VIRU|nr:hypothetical protein [Camel associated porprismacovirus 1]AIY31251.1 hypothetical protein [Camel associated porprismacovirus 1]
MSQSITVSIVETYDLSTTENRMGLIAIKTPSMTAVNKRYPGFIRNFKFLHVNSCDVVLSCASTLPTDPLQIGTTAGKVAPQDMFNPLLYKAVSNDSWNGLLSRIYSPTGASVSLNDDVRHFADAFPDATSTESVRAYYAMLADPSFKKAHIQAGLSMRGLRPLVYHLLSGSGTNTELTGAGQPTAVGQAYKNYVDDSGDAYQRASNNLYSGTTLFKGRPVPMPSVQTTPAVVHPSDGTVTQIDYNVVLGGIPSTYVCAIVVPPHSLNTTYFRMTVKWSVTFHTVASEMSKALMPGMSDLGRYAYYTSETSKLEPVPIEDVSDTAVTGDTVDADGVSLDLVMEK